MTLPPAEHLQAEPARERSDFWLGFIAGVFCVGFFWAAREGVWAVAERSF